ncbi:MAG: aspartyl protease family protein [Deltaproteobacteria bacterium]|nr:aspartyl protease family protein [Deltaproteobacteria bacterium]MBW2445465.1 aspartyl protease family protein [Deltaproteobacteria bacterium]
MRRMLLVLALVWALPSQAGEPPPEAVLADLPFLDSPEPNRIFIDLAHKGYSRALRFMVDTGATHNIATPRAAADLGIRVRRHKQDPYRRKTILGRDVQVHVDTRSSDTGSRTGWEYTLLGGDFMRHYVVEFDFVKHRVRFLDREKFEVPESVTTDGQAVVRIRTPNNRPGVELELNGKTILVLVDTGAPPPILVSGKVADAVGLPESGLPDFATQSTLGPMVSELRMLESLKLGPFLFSDIPAVVNPRGFYNLGMSNDSVIGYELLAQFSRVRIDYHRRRMWLERNPDAVLTFGGRPFESLEGLLTPIEPEPPYESPN